MSKKVDLALPIAGTIIPIVFLEIVLYGMINNWQLGQFLEINVLILSVAMIFVFIFSFAILLTEINFRDYRDE